MKKILKKLYFKIKIGGWKQQSIVLMLHSINAKASDKTGVNISKDRFEELLDKFEFQKISDIVDNIKPGIALSFDDGRSDIYDDVFPLLKEKNIPFTIFVTYNLLDTKGYLTKKQLLELSKEELVTIGSHCMNHIVLTQYPIDIQKKEILESKKKLEEVIEEKIEYIAYSYGQYNKDAINVLKSGGEYKNAFIASGYFVGNRRYSKGRMNISNRDYDNNIELLEILNNYI